MSIRLMTTVWEMDLPATDKMVLLALADAANDDGITWIALKSRSAGKRDLILKCSLSERAIQGAIKRLCEAGHLARDEKVGRGVIYTVTPAGNAPPQQMRPAADAPAPAADAGKPSIPVSEAKASSHEAVDQVVSAYNDMAAKAKVQASRSQDGSLRQKIRLRVKDHGLETVLETIAIAGASSFLRGEGRETNWRLTLDWLMTPANFRKVLDGAYGGLPQAEESPDAKIRTYEARAAWFRDMDKPDDAKRCLDLAAQLRAAAAQDTNRRFTPVQIGKAIRIEGGLGTQ